MAPVYSSAAPLLLRRARERHLEATPALVENALGLVQGAAVADEKLIFRPVIEALFVEGLADRMTPAFRAQLKTLGVDLERLRPGYPYADWERAVESIPQLFPELERPEAIAEAGRRMTVATIERNPVGKHLMPLLKMMGTGRALRRAYSRTGEGNFNLITFGAESPKSLEIQMSFVGAIPDLARGSIVGVGQMLGAPVRSKTVQYEAPAATFLVEWD